MAAQPFCHRYFVGLFDILGFEDRFRTLGITEVARRYGAFVHLIADRNSSGAEISGAFGGRDWAMWAAGGEVFVFNQISGAYSSDSLMLWAHAEFPEACDLSDDERAALATDKTTGWAYHVVPCDQFLDACSDLVCLSLLIGLPLRGGIAMGKAILDEDRKIFLGQPIIDAARIEAGQNMIGVGMSHSFVRQTIPKRFSLPFCKHMKQGLESYFSGHVLDWPRRWGSAARNGLREIVASLNIKPAASHYYDNTLSFLDASDAVRDKFVTPIELSVRDAYPQFASKDLELHVRAVRSAGVGISPGLPLHR